MEICGPVLIVNFTQRWVRSCNNWGVLASKYCRRYLETFSIVVSKLNKITSLRKSQNKITHPSFKRIWSLVRWFLVFRRQYLLLKWTKKNHKYYFWLYDFLVSSLGCRQAAFFFLSIYSSTLTMEKWKHFHSRNKAPFLTKLSWTIIFLEVLTITRCKHSKKKSNPSISTLTF